MPKLVYIAGPYRAKNAWLTEQNIREAEWHAFQVASAGAFPVCPHTNTRGYFECVGDADFWLRGTMKLMVGCDAVYAITGWLTSRGACAEIKEATARGIPIFNQISDLRAWLETS